MSGPLSRFVVKGVFPELGIANVEFADSGGVRANVRLVRFGPSHRNYYSRGYVKEDLDEDPASRVAELHVAQDHES
jgi:hypothetical protein